MKTMITAGIDVGFERIKIVILNDGKRIAKGIGFTEWTHRSEAIEKLLLKTLEPVSLSALDIEKTVATGIGKFDVHFADARVVEPVAIARTACFVLPSAAAAVDIGADQTRVITLGEGYNIQEVVLNQKCSAGLGILLKYAARRLGFTLEELSDIVVDAESEVVVNDGCAVFAELDVLELLNHNTPKKDIAGALIASVAAAINAILNDKITPDREKTVLMGGVSQNMAVVNALKIRSGIDFHILEDAEYGGALGAALIAAD
jgi:predicted CoA-substrate-specific enzyme activase